MRGFTRGLVPFVKFKKRLKHPRKSHYLLAQSNNGNTRTMCEICSKLTRETPE